MNNFYDKVLCLDEKEIKLILYIQHSIKKMNYTLIRDLIKPIKAVSLTRSQVIILFLERFCFDFEKKRCSKNFLEIRCISVNLVYVQLLLQG